MLESICFRVLRLSLQMSILLLLSFLGNKWLTRRFAAQARCFLWMAFSIRLLIPASLSFALPSWGAEIQKATEAALPSAAQVGQAEAPAFVDVLPMGSTAGFAAPAEISYGQISAGEGIALLWLIGAVCFLLAHVGIHVFHMRFLRAHSEIVCGGGQQDLLEQIREELHVRRNLPVWICGKVDSPMLTGLFHPTLILPRTGFSQEQRMFIFRHELAHYKRRDLWTKWVFLLAQSVHWFNPLVHILAKKANLDLENACDDTVLKGKDRLYRKAYGTVLLDVLTNQTHAVPLSTHFIGRKEEMIGRFRNMINTAPKKKGYGFLCCVLVGMVLLTSTLYPAPAQAVSAGASSQPQSTPEEIAETRALLTECLKGSMFEGYVPYQELPLSQENYDRCEKAEQAYRSLLLKADARSIAQEYRKNPSFLAVYGQGEKDIQSGLFCCQANADIPEGNRKMHFIWLDFSDVSNLQVMDVGTIYPGRGNDVDERVQEITRQWHSIEEAATEFNIDLSQYEKAFSMMDPAIIENQADNLGWSLQEQLKRMRGYQFEQFHHRQMTAFIKKDHTEGVMIHMDRSGTYVHYFEVPTIAERNQRKTLESQFPIFRSECKA